jgi:hypothetical protein
MKAKKTNRRYATAETTDANQHLRSKENRRRMTQIPTRHRSTIGLSQSKNPVFPVPKSSTMPI